MERNIRLYYIISFLNGSWFQVGNWLIFALFYVNEYEFGIYEAIAFALGFVLEIPTGAIADLLGKKKTAVLGNIMLTLGCILFTLGYLSKWYLFWGNLVIIGIAFPLISGSMEALIYDSLVQLKKTEIYDKVASRAAMFHSASFIVAPIIGGLVWNYNYFLPWILTSITFAVSTVFTFFLKEPRIDTEHFNFKNFLKQNIKGFKIFLLPDLRYFLILYISMFGGFFMWSTGMIRVIMGTDLGFDGASISYVISFISLVGLILVALLPRFRKSIGDFKGITFLLFLIGISYCAAYYSQNITTAVLIFLGINIAGVLSKPWISTIVNKYTDSKYRATTISTLSFLIQLPYILIAPLYGKLAEESNTRIFYLYTGILLLVILIYALIFLRKFKF